MRFGYICTAVFWIAAGAMLVLPADVAQPLGCLVLVAAGVGAMTASEWFRRLLASRAEIGRRLRACDRAVAQLKRRLLELERGLPEDVDGKDGPARQSAGGDER